MSSNVRTYWRHENTLSSFLLKSIWHAQRRKVVDVALPESRLRQKARWIVRSQNPGPFHRSPVWNVCFNLDCSTAETLGLVILVGSVYFNPNHHLDIWKVVTVGSQSHQLLHAAYVLNVGDIQRCFLFMLHLLIEKIIFVSTMGTVLIKNLHFTE